MKTLKNFLLIAFLILLAPTNLLHSQSPEFNFLEGGLFLGNSNDATFSTYLSVDLFVDFKEDSTIDSIQLQGDLFAIIPGNINTDGHNAFKFEVGLKVSPDVASSYARRYDDSHVEVRIPMTIHIPRTFNRKTGGFCILVETLDPGNHMGIRYMQFIPKPNPVDSLVLNPGWPVKPDATAVVAGIDGVYAGLGANFSIPASNCSPQQEE